MELTPTSVWYKCIEARTGSPEKKLKSAMRSAIQDQIDHFKSNALQSPLVCKICSKSIIATGDMHVHHNPSFAELAENFIRENSPPPTQFDENLTMREAQFTPESEEYSKRWQDYHHQYANLEITHKDCNLRQPKKREAQILIPF